MLATGTATARKPARFPAEPGGLTEEQLAQFHKEGYVVIDGLLDPEKDIAPIIAEYATVLDRLAQELFDAGQISSTYADLPFSERLTKVYAESGKVHAQYFDFSLPQTGVTHDTPLLDRPGRLRGAAPPRPPRRDRVDHRRRRSTPTPSSTSG